MYVRQTITFESLSLDLGSSYLHNRLPVVRFMFVHEGHRVKVNVTGTKNSYSCNVNFGRP